MFLAVGEVLFELVGNFVFELLSVRLRPADAVSAADRAAIPESQRSEVRPDRKRGRFGDAIFRTEGACRERDQLDRDGAGQRLAHDPAVARSARAVVRQDVAAR